MAESVERQLRELREAAVAQRGRLADYSTRVLASSGAGQMTNEQHQALENKLQDALDAAWEYILALEAATRAS